MVQPRLDCMDAPLSRDPMVGVGGFLPWEVLKFLSIVAVTNLLVGMKIVKCSVPYHRFQLRSRTLSDLSPTSSLFSNPLPTY